MRGNETALLPAFAAWLVAPHWTTLPLAYQGVREFSFTACAKSLPGLKLQINSRKKLLQLLISGVANPPIELSIHGRSELQKKLRILRRFLSLFCQGTEKVASCSLTVTDTQLEHTSKNFKKQQQGPDLVCKKGRWYAFWLILSYNRRNIKSLQCLRHWFGHGAHLGHLAHLALQCWRS